MYCVKLYEGVYMKKSVKKIAFSPPCKHPCVHITYLQGNVSTCIYYRLYNCYKEQKKASPLYNFMVNVFKSKMNKKAY